MKAYLNNGCISWLEDIDAPTEFEMSWELTDIQADFLRNGATCQLQGGELIVVPVAVEVADPDENDLVITKREFLARFTPDEYVAIKEACVINHTADYYWQLFMVSEEIDLDFSDTIMGVRALEQLGLLAAGRAAEILS